MRAFLTCALFVAPLAGYASDWQSVASRDTSFFYMDFDSLANIGAYKKAWIKADFYKAQETGAYPKKEYHSTKSLYYFDCGAKRLGSIQFIAYEKLGGAGDIIMSSSEKFDSAKLDDAVPDTMGEKFLTVACGSASARTKIKKENATSLAAAEKEIQEYLKKTKQEQSSSN